MDCGGSTDMHVVGESFCQANLDKLGWPQAEQDDVGEGFGPDPAAGPDTIAILKPESPNLMTPTLRRCWWTAYRLVIPAVRMRPSSSRSSNGWSVSMAVLLRDGSRVHGGWFDDDGSIGGHASAWLSYNPDKLR